MALVPTARLAHPWLVALTFGLAALPTLFALARGRSDLFAPMVVAGLAAGAAVGWAADDPAAELLATLPTGGPLRSVMRVTAAGAVAGAGSGALAVAVALGPGLPPSAGDRWPEAGAAAGSALAAGFVGARRGERAAGAGAVIVGLLVPTVVAALAVRIGQLPSFLAGPHHARWWLAALVGACVALHAGRDPARRRHRPGAGHRGR